MIYFEDNNPCVNGHIFLWGSSDLKTEPPQDYPCQCGETIFKSNTPDNTPLNRTKPVTLFAKDAKSAPGIAG